MNEKEQILFQVGWLTNMKTIYIPPKMLEEIERLRLQENEYICNMFKVRVMFLQQKRFTTKTVLSKNDTVNDESKLLASDLTKDGIRFYLSGIQKWIAKLDRSINRIDIVTDTSFLEKKYQEYINFELPFFKKLLSETNNDKKILENKKTFAPIIDKVISELEGKMKDFFTKRNKKTTIDLMYVRCGYLKKMQV